MVINIRDYTERWLNDYIVYHAGHFANEYRDLDRAGLYFDLKYQEAMDNLQEGALVGQMEAIQQNMQALAPGAASALNLYDALQNGSALENAMDQIAQALNQGIELAYSNNSVSPDNYEQVLQEASKFNTLLAQGSPEIQEVNAFFDLVLQGMTMAGKINTDLLNGLTRIGQHLTGNTSFQLNQQWNNKAVTTLTVMDMKACENVLRYLDNAMKKFDAASYTSGGTTISKSPGMLSAASFGGTIKNIFNKQIGERLARTILASGIKQAVNKSDSIFNQLVQSGQLKLGNGKLTMGGDRRDQANRVSKVDIFNQRAFQLSVTENGQTYDIEIGLNTSVKWYSGLKENNEIHMVAGSPLGSYFKSGTPEHYLAYNVIAHRASPGGYDEVFRTLKASVAATFFNEWISGTGARIKRSTAYVNKVQYLMVNGRIYSVMRIIRNICNEIARTNNWNSAFNLDISRNDSNKWIGNNPNIPDAMVRSQLVNKVMDKLVIGATLNSNILLQYAY